MAFRSVATVAGASGTSTNVPVPTGAAIGDIAVVGLYMENTDTVTPPTGFTLKSSLATSGGTRGSLRVFWKRLTAADTGSYLFSYTTDSWSAGVAMLFSGRVASGDPFEATGTAESTTAVATLNVSMTTTTAGCDAVGFWTNFNGGGDFTPPTNYTERADLSGVITADTRDNIAAGATGNVTATCIISDFEKAFLGALLPAAGGGTTPVTPATRATTWRVLSRVTQTRATTWNAKARVTQTRATTWNVNAVGQVSATRTTTWNVKARTTQTRATTWDVLSRITPTRATTWRVRARATTTRATTWNVISTAPVYPWPTTTSGRNILDQNGRPWLMVMDSQWDIISWGGGRNELGAGTTPQAVYDGYAAAAGANKFNAVLILAINSNQNGEVGPFQDGRLWDGVAVWGAGGIGDLNAAYWDRVEGFVQACQSNGLTVVMNILSTYTIAAGTALAGLNNTNAATYGTALGNRFKNYPNIIWQVGVDYFGDDDTQLPFLINAIQATGDTHLITVQYYAESNSRSDSAGGSGGTFGANSDVSYDDVYTYNAGYVEVERAYAYSTSPGPVRPTLLTNGYYDTSAASSTTGAERQKMHDLWGWALTSGSRSIFYGSEGQWAWGSGAYAAVSSQTIPNNDLGNLVTWWTALDGWEKLNPDFGTTFIKNGRGTKLTGITPPGGSGTPYSSGNDYCTGARQAFPGRLAVLYTPTARTLVVSPLEFARANSTTIPTTARWVDPTNGATTTATMTPSGGNYSYAHPGTNSAGLNNWYLVIEAPAMVTATRSTTWNVAAPSGTTKVTATRSTTWDVLARVTQTRATTWNVMLQQVSATRATTWKVKATVAAQRATTWNVASTKVQVTGTRATTWRVRATITGQRATTWNVTAFTKTPVANSRATTWRVRAQVPPALRVAKWNVRGNTTTWTPPTYEEPIRVSVKPLIYYRLTTADSVVRVNGTFTTVRNPSVELLDAAGEHGVDYFIGGHIYELLPATVAELQAAGFTV